jgi:hypothetical protein
MASASMLPAFVGTTFSALDQLAQAAGHLCSAVNHVSATIDDAAAGLHEITNIMITSQKANLLANLAEA